MNDALSTILDNHEADDYRQTNTDALLLSAMEKEFSNARELFRAAAESSLSLRDLLSGKVADFPVIPIRQSMEFYIKKHTESQIPYFHNHEFYELIYVHRGNSLQQFKDGSKLLLTEGQCLLLTPLAGHKMGKCRSSDIVLKVVIPRGIFDRTGGEVLGDRLCEKAIVFENMSETAKFTLLKLLEEQSRNMRFRDLLIDSYLTVIFVELVNSPRRDLALELTLNRYFEENIQTATLSEFAAMQNYNPHYISRLIRNRTGKTFSTLLSLYRLSRAKQLLTESALTIEDIAVEVGYSNPSGLYKQFFSSLGMKPSQYRNLLK